MFDWQALVGAIVARLRDEADIEGIFLSGSLVNEDLDPFSDVDLGLATANEDAAFERVWSLRHAIMQVVGEPVHFIERGWDDCQMVAALYGKGQFPPIGLEVDVVFSRLRHVTQQMPYTPYRIVYDRSGALRAELGQLTGARSDEETRQELLQHIRSFPFYLHDVQKAILRGDSFHAQSLIEGMRQAVVAVAAVRDGRAAFSTKRAARHLSDAERRILQLPPDALTVEDIGPITHLFDQCLAQVQDRYRLRPEVSQLREALCALKAVDS
jgi:predicted nucleotidyltransferase